RIQVAHKLASCLRMIGNPHAAIEAGFQALKERDDWAEVSVGLAQAFQMICQWDRAERWAKRTLEQGIPNTALIINPVELTLIPWMVIAEACANTGRTEEAQAAMQQALALAPDNEYVRGKSEELRRLAGENEIVGAISLLREVLVRHDENLKAYELLERAV